MRGWGLAAGVGRGDPFGPSSATRACKRLYEDKAVLECDLGFVKDQQDPE